MWKLHILVVLLFITGCAPLKEQGLKEYKETRAYLGAYVTIECFYSPENDMPAASKKCWERMDEIQKRMNAYAQDGDVAAINRSGLSGVKVHSDVYRLLQDSVGFSNLTEGAFDATIFPLVGFWKDAAKKGRIPSKAAIATVKDKVGYQNLRFKAPDRVILAKQGMKIDLGGIVSGYACDELARVLSAYGIKNFLVDTGGEILCKGKNKGRWPWLIGIQDPKNKDKILRTIALNDRAVSTSGTYEKFNLIEGQRFSHIIDPISGYPEKDVISVTVIAKTCEEADALSTALCVLGAQKAIALIKRLNGVEALIIENKDGKTVQAQSPVFPPDK